MERLRKIALALLIFPLSASPQWTIGSRAFSSNDFYNGLVECWPMNDGSGSSFADGCGTGNTETLQAGTLTWASNTGLPGTTATFSSTAWAYGTNNTATNFDGSTPFSIGVWVNLASVTDAQHAILSTLDLNNNFIGWEINITSPGSLTFVLLNTLTTNGIKVDKPNDVPANTLTFIVVTYDGSKKAAGVSFYINGSLTIPLAVAYDTLTGSTSNTKNVAIGGRTDGTIPVNGLISYVHIWNRVLSSTDVTNYYNACSVNGVC